MSDSPYIFEVTQDNFAEVVIANSRRVPVLVDFWADWCAPCRALTPVLEKIVAEYQGRLLLAKINTDEQQTVAAQFGIRSLPSVKLVKDGAIIDEFTGAQPEGAIRQLLERHITPESPVEDVQQRASELLDAGDVQSALALLDEAIQADPADAALKMILARACMQNGEAERAEIILGDLDDDTRATPAAQAVLAQLNFARIAQAEPDSAGLGRRIADNPGDLQARYHLSAHQIVNGEFEAALEQLLAIMQRDRKFEDDAGRKGMISVFDILGGSGELVSRYRTKLANALN